MVELVVIVLLGVFVWYVFKQRAKARSKRKDDDVGSFVYRTGKNVKAGEAFFAWNSGDIHQMVGALEVDTNPIDRHFLLQNLVDETYKRRADPEMAGLCAKVAEMHLGELPQIIPALKQDMGGILPLITTFQRFTTLLTERGEFDRAIQVCEDALRHDLNDGTKGGYQGRIERIKKKAKRSKE